MTTLIFGVMAFTGSNVIPGVETAATRGAEADIEDDIEAAGRTFVDALMTFDFREIDANLEALVDLTTEAFAGQHHAAFNGTIDDFRANVLRDQAQSASEVKGVAVSSHDDSTATAIVFVAQTIRNSERPEPRNRFRVLELTMISSSGTWKVDNVGNPSVSTQ